MDYFKSGESINSIIVAEGYHRRALQKKRFRKKSGFPMKRNRQQILRKILRDRSGAEAQRHSICKLVYLTDVVAHPDDFHGIGAAVNIDEIALGNDH